MLVHLALPCGQVAMGVLTVHHWSDRARGLAEMSRIPAALPSLHALPVRRPALMAAPWPVTA
jgi:hypothetical protein